MDTPELSGLRWLFLDLNSYFASVEQNENPSLIGKPVVVVPMMTESTCVIAASYEAKAYGIRTGTKVFDALRMCPKLICVLARHDIYVDYHHRILQAVDKHLPVHKVWSIDEFDCEHLGRQRHPEAAKKLALSIKKQIYHDIGEAIRCSIGIAPNSFLAKIATDLQKPDGLVALRPEMLPGPLFTLSLTDLPGINTRMEERLFKAGIKTVDQLWNIAPKRARAIWGNVSGERFWYWLHGYDAPVPETNPSMVGHSRVLDPGLRTPEKTRMMGRRLLFKSAIRLRRKMLHATHVSLNVRMVKGDRWGGEARFPAAQDPFTFLSYFNMLWDQMVQQSFNGEILQLRNRAVFKKISVALYGLKEKEFITDDLFDTSLEQRRQKMGKQEALTQAIEHLQAKYKKETVWLGVVPKTLAGHVGTKIAFSRVPEKEEFWN